MTDPRAAGVKLPTAQEVYDTIMGYIEPELTTEQLKTLDAKYAGESPSEKSERMERYRKAFHLYEVAYGIYEKSIRRSAEKSRLSTQEHQRSSDSPSA